MSNSHGNRTTYRCDRCAQTIRSSREPGVCHCGRPFRTGDPCPRPFDPALILVAVNRGRAPWRHLTITDLCADLEVSLLTWRLAASEWLTDLRADQWACRAGLNPWEIWPNWIDVGMDHTDVAHVAIWSLRGLVAS